MPSKKITRAVRIAASATIVALATATALAGCSGSGSGKTVITLSGPNQFNSDTSSFGPAWDKLVAAFENKNPDIELKTNVLPIASWAQASATQLSAGTAPELIFNQTTHTPKQVHSLDSYLNKPNPFVSGNKKWIDVFDPKYFGGSRQLGVNANGHYEWIPFNLVGIALYYNKDALKKAGVDVSSLKTYDGFVKSCTALKKAGYAPVATDNGQLTQGWEMAAIGSTMFDDFTKKINVYDGSGNAGTSDPIAGKSIAKAVLTDQLDLTTNPNVKDAMELLKKFNDACATPNWSGIQASGAFTGGPDFQAGKAAMAWGTNFASTNLSDAKFSYGTLTFPTISSSDSKYASGQPAEFGVSTGGTSYMIPSYIKGAKLAAAVKFLQFVSSPNVEDWLKSTGSIPAVKGLQAPSGLGAFLDGTWGTVPPQGLAGAYVESPKALSGKNPYEGYLIGQDSLETTLATAQQNNVAWAKEQVADAGWTDSWTK